MVSSIFLLLIVPGLTYGSILRETSGLCRTDEFTCSNGACVDVGLTCNGASDCADGSDEDVCSGITNADLDQVFSREKRQTSVSRCRRGQWQCRSGACISFDGKCDGVVDCPDGSDESFALCRNNTCHSNWFRCAYGACVDGTAPCNDVQECADNSDELLPRCRNSTNGALGVFNCDNGQIISTADACDGVKTCSDGSDETLRACADKSCPRYQFQCAYGACADQDANCNGKEDCADGSDESDELCRPDQVPLTTTTTTPGPIQEGNCILPPYPLHGTYTVGGDTKARPGDAYRSVLLTYACSSGYGLDVENGQMYCQEGTWYGGDFPKCVHFCRLNQHQSVTYRCIITGSRGEEGTRNCNPYEPVGTVVRVDCKKPNYYSPVPLTLMRCLEGGWDTYPICAPGVLREGTNITIVIKDVVQIYVNKLAYGEDPNKQQPNATAAFNNILNTINTNISQGLSFNSIPIVININNNTNFITNNSNIKEKTRRTNIIHNQDVPKSLPNNRDSTNVKNYQTTESITDNEINNFIDEEFWRIGTVSKN